MKILRGISTKNIIVYNVFVLLLLAGAGCFYLQWNNTLYQNGRWESSKIKLEKGVMGSWSYFLTYRALSFNRLDLGAWHAYQEVFLKDPPEADSVSFRFRLREDSYFSFFYAQQGPARLGIRLSNTAVYPSAIIEVKDYRFTNYQPLTLTIRDGWNSFSVRNASDERRFYLNGRLIFSEPAEAHLAQSLTGFRGGQNSVLIDNIRIVKLNGEVFMENFGWQTRRILLPFLILLLLANLTYLFWPFRRGTLLLITANVSIIIFMLSMFFIVYWQRNYPPSWMINWRSKRTTIETTEEVAERFMYPAEADESDLRIMFIGTSQTWGAGASTTDKTFESLYLKMLGELYTEAHIRIINTGISGPNSDYLLSLYRDKWINLHPDLCIINLGCNDFENAEFENNLREFLRLNCEKGIESILITEPMADQSNRHNENHNIIRRLGTEMQIKVIDMQRLFDHHSQKAYLWWDFVHFTDYGHRLFAEELLIESADILKKIMDHQNRNDN